MYSSKCTKMNKLLFLFCLPLLFLTACLHDEPHGSLSEQQAYDNATNLYVNTVATLYANIGGSRDGEGLQGTYKGVYDYNTFCTDEAVIPIRGGDWYDGGFWENLYLHRWTSNDPELLTLWNYLYRVVMLSNRSLDRLAKHRNLLSDADYARYCAEVRAVRALFYFELLDLFGGVPVVTKAEARLEDVRPARRSEVYAFVNKELREVLPLLPNVHSNVPGSYYGRITRPVVFFLLARLALNAEVYADDDPTDGHRPSGDTMRLDVNGRTVNAWQATVAYCDSLTAAGYTLEPNYADNFKVANEQSRENIFTIVTEKTLYPTLFKNLFRSRHYAQGGAQHGVGENGSCATPATLDIYGYGTSREDRRFALNFYADTVRENGVTVMQDAHTPLIYRAREVKLSLTGSPYEKTAGARMHKYAPDPTAYSDGQLADNDIVLFRYADALLMRAEAKVRLGESGDEELNRVRARVGMAPRTATLEHLLEERLLELMWEGTRRADLVRFDLFHKAYTLRPALSDEADRHTTVFPIPARMLQLNPNLKQNPGYR